MATMVDAKFSLEAVTHPIRALGRGAFGEVFLVRAVALEVPLLTTAETERLFKKHWKEYALCLGPPEKKRSNIPGHLAIWRLLSIETWTHSDEVATGD